MTDVVHRLPRGERFGARSVDGGRYTQPETLSREIEQVFKRGWVVACTAAAVDKPGSVAVLREQGVDVVVTRDTHGQLRAFHNRCMHRGSRLAQGCGQHADLTCGYHGWRYGLDGEVKFSPGADGFGGIDVSKMRLKSVRVEASCGLVWVCLDVEQAALSEAMAGIASELEPYKLGQMEPIQERVFDLPVNWKVMLENAFDFYHVAQVHPASVHAHVNTPPERVVYGDHQRQNIHIAPYAWRRFIDARCSRGGPYTEKQRSQLFKYTLFPNTIINVLPYHLTVMRVWPDGTDRCRLHYGFYQRRGARGLEWLRARGTWLASRVILAEDVRMLVRCQTGMDAEVVPQHLLHDHEAASAHFHQVLGAWLGD